MLMITLSSKVANPFIHVIDVLRCSHRDLGSHRTGLTQR
eukprot:UN12449